MQQSIIKWVHWCGRTALIYSLTDKWAKKGYVSGLGVNTASHTAQQFLTNNNELLHNGEPFSQCVRVWGRINTPTCAYSLMKIKSQLQQDKGD